ncbi:Resolvase, holliday junction-type, YqgF-like protein [Candidatus Omnitrophus magneticus]|uniref:Putative pre-16S rRNA nuclease n=1 Tax=Candidatus Omnitrophus magneticus TaxID=1609969 RepID=A0A0F0CU78_9BACT|nr:Resolvase, holliday junction-type, YqgF-like protein [Candidatus Omnitrophus magneticus]
MRVMALDIGTKNIGVAISDEMGIIAQGKETIRYTSDESTLIEIQKFVKDYSVGKIVISLPINMNGSSGERVEASRHIAEIIKIKLGIEIVFWDERLSTKEAETIMISAGISRYKRKKKIDKVAATIILQNYLDWSGNA